MAYTVWPSREGHFVRDAPLLCSRIKSYQLSWLSAVARILTNLSRGLCSSTGLYSTWIGILSQVGFCSSIRCRVRRIWSFWTYSISISRLASVCGQDVSPVYFSMILPWAPCGHRQTLGWIGLLVISAHVNQAITWSTHGPISRPAFEPLNRPTKQPIDRPTYRPINPSTLTL